MSDRCPECGKELGCIRYVGCCTAECARRQARAQQLVRLAAEHEALVAALKETTDRYGPNIPEGQRIRTTLYLVTGDESYIQDMPKWARELARKSSLADCMRGWER